MPDLVPFDRASEDLIGLYEQAAREIDVAVRTALARGAIGTAAYREAQQNVIRTRLANLKGETPPRALAAAANAYGMGALTVDAAFPDNTIRGKFRSSDTRAVQAIAVNMSRALTGAADELQASTAHVFEIADRLEGALPGARSELGAFLGRRVDDDARRAALQTIGSAILQGSTRRDASQALKARIQTLAAGNRSVDDALQMVKDELTGEARAAFIDRAGRRWDLDVYTRMVARTTTREAATRGAVERLITNGEDLVKISAHNTTTELCQHYEGKTFSLSGRDPEHPRLDRLPPFHPNCRHYLQPAGGDFEALERELAAAAAAPPPSETPPVAKMTPRQAEALKLWESLPKETRTYQQVADALGVTVPRARVYVRQARHAVEGTSAKRRRPGDAVKLIDAPRPPAPPFSDNAVPRIIEITDEGLQDQRISHLIDGDPGPEEGAVEAWEDAIALEARAERRGLDRLMGEELTKMVDSAWGKRYRVREKLMRGEMTLEEVEREADAEWNRREEIRLEREAERERKARFLTRAVNCPVCGRFKSKPGDICDYCGDTPFGGVDYAGGLSDGGDFYDRQRAYNIAHGYAPD